MKIEKACFLVIIGLLISLNSLGQSRCDTTNTWWVTTEKPECNISINELEAKLNEVMKPQDFRIENTFFRISFIINCKGEDFNYSVHEIDNKEFCESLIEYCKKYTDWTAGQHEGNSIDVAMNIIGIVQHDSLNLLNEKELKKLKKRNK